MNRREFRLSRQRRIAPRLPRTRLARWGLLLLAACALDDGRAKVAGPRGESDLVLRGGRVWTGERKAATGRIRVAEAVAVRGESVVAVGRNEEVRGWVGSGTEVVELGGRLVVPGFNDTHVHFAQAGALLLGPNLLDCHEGEEMRRRVADCASRLPKGEWITGGDWGAYERWPKESSGAATAARGPFRPDRALLDPVTPDHPALLSKFDRSEHLANGLALRLAGIGPETPDPPGGGIERDSTTGEPTGVLRGTAVELVRRAIPEPSFERRLAEARVALAEAARFGVTSLQDMSPPAMLRVYAHLLDRGELTARIHYRPTLDRWREVAALGLLPGTGTPWIRFGAVKGFVDGIMGNRTARFFEPYEGEGEDRGRWREMADPPAKLRAAMLDADRAGVQLSVHAIGDEANAFLLEALETMHRENGERDRRFRLVHAQVLRVEDFARLRRLRPIAEVQPYHLSDDMRWMEERIGRDRCRGAYAFRSLREAGAVLAFGSDWPGTNASYYPVNPLFGVYAAVTRRTLAGDPPGAWFPEEAIGLEEALLAYTSAGAYASFEEERKGTLAPGKWADLAVLSLDPFATDPAEWLSAAFDLTVVGGRIVHQRERAPGASISPRSPSGR